VLAWLALAGCDLALGLDDRVDPRCLAGDYDPARYAGVDAHDLTWFQARQRCVDVGMDLVVLNEGDASELANQSAGQTLPFWIGVSFGVGWEAVDQCTPHLSWAPGEPAHEDAGDCVQVTAAGMVSLRCNDSPAPTYALCEAPR